MKRRDFIKAFAATAASVPLATTLASTKGSEKVIETFQMSDIPTGFNDDRDKTVVKYLQEYESNFTTTPNNNIQQLTYNTGFNSPILFLARSYPNYKALANHLLSRYGFSWNKLHYVSDHTSLLGIRRNIKIVGIYEYWQHPDINKIMEYVYVKGVTILTPDKFFRNY